MKKNNKKGFTLVELLAVIVILAILATAAYTLIIPKINENKPKTFISDIATISEAYDNYATTGGALTTVTYNSMSCKYVTIANLISNGALKFTGNTAAMGLVAVCNKEYYISYTNGKYMTTKDTLVKTSSVTVSDAGELSNAVSCTSTSCEAMTSLTADQNTP